MKSQTHHAQMNQLPSKLKIKIDKFIVKFAAT